MAFLNETGLEQVWGKIKTKVSSIENTIDDINEAKVDKVSGKGLSTNDFTTDEKNKLAGIATGATKVIVDSTLSNTSTNAIQNKVVANMKSDIDDALSAKLDTITISGDGNIITDISKSGTTINAKKNAFATTVKEGNPVSEIGIAGAGFSVKTTFEPKQEGSGDPYPAGGGKNLLNNTSATQTVNGITFTVNSDGTITANGTATANAYFYINADASIFETNTDYMLSGCPGGGSTSTYRMSFQYYDSSNTLKFYGNDVGGGTKLSFTETLKNPQCFIVVYSGTTISNIVFKPMIEKGSTATEYAPYANIRPISGRTGVELTRCGKNLLPTGTAQTIKGVTFTPNADGSISVKGTATGNVFYGANGLWNTLNVKGGTEYILSGTPANAPKSMYIAIVGGVMCKHGIEVAFSYDADTDISVVIVVESGSTVDYVFHPMIRLASIADAAYEPYQGNTYSADFGQTAYGGTLDWNTGVLTVEWGCKAFDGTESIDTENNYYVFWAENVPQDTINVPGICSHYPYKKYYASDEKQYGLNISYGIRFHVDMTVYPTADDFKAYLAAQYAAGTPVQVCYKLATPTTIQLTPHDLHMLDGTNTVYSDGNTNYVIFNSGASSLGKANELFFKKTDTIPVSNGGTGATSASGARTNLEVPSKTGEGASGTWGIDITGSSNKISYSTQLTTDDAINAFNTDSTFQVSTWINTSSPGVSNGIIINAGWTSGNYGAQIAIDDDPTYYIALRQRDNNGWNAWKRIPMGDGTGASGTWGIHISGTAEEAKRLQPSVFLQGNAANTNIYWNPFTWEIGTAWYGCTGIYALSDAEGSFNGIFRVKVRNSDGATVLSNKEVTWLSASSTTPPTLTLTTTINSASITYRLYISSGSSTWRTYKISKIMEDGVGPTIATGYSTSMIGTVQDSSSAISATLADYALKMQTYKQGSTAETYGTSYLLYAQWETDSILKLKCDNYTVKTDTATKLATARTITIGNTGKTFDGSENVSWSLSEIGAADASSTVQVFNRTAIGTSPNYDNPGVNGLFEVRATSETPGETGTKPFNSFGPFLNLKTSDNIAMLQLAANGTEIMYRANQAGGVTMSGVAWKTLLSSSNYNSYSPTLTGGGASGTWEISITGGAAAAIQDGNGNVINSTYCKLSGGNPMDVPANGNFTASSTSGAWFYDSGFGLCSIGRGNGDGASLGASGKANLFIKSWNGIGFVSTQANTGVAVAINCRTGEVLANKFTGSGASLTSLNASNITSGTLAVSYGGTGSTSKSGARTNLGITSGTSLPSASGYAAGDIFILY